MGAAACKNSKSTLPNQPKDDQKNITIGVFGLNDAGKTSAVKVIEGGPTKNVSPTIGSISTMVTDPLSNEKNKNQQRIKIIDVSGQKKYRQQSWSQYYDQIHGLIYVVDASESERLSENQETLDELLKNEKLKDKPILILANKQDERGAINNERELKKELEIERLKTKHKIELCTASPRNSKNKADDSIREGFSWLIRNIDNNYSSLNARVTKAKTAPITRRFNRSDSDDNDSDNKYSKDKTRSKITSEKLPSINRSTFKAHSDDDDDIYPSSKNDLNKKKSGGTNGNDRFIKKPNDNELKAFRSTFESLPEEAPWSPSSALKSTKSDDTLPRLYGKPGLATDTKRYGMSPLVHDTKSYTNGSSYKRDNNSDGEDDYMRQQKSKVTTSRFDSSSYPTNRFSSTTNTNTKKTTGGIYDDDYSSSSRRINSATKKTYDDDDDDDIYPKKSTTTATTKFNKNYDFDDNKTYPRSNFNSDYRGALSKPGSQSPFKYDNDNRSPPAYSKKETRSRFDNDDDDDDYTTSKTKARSKYSDDDDDDRWSPSKPATTSKYDNRSKYDNDDRLYSSSKTTSHSKFDDDDDYPSSKPATRSNYNTPSKTTAHSRFDDDDDDDDYPSSTKKTTYPSSYNSRVTGSRFDNDDY